MKFQGTKNFVQIKADEEIRTLDPLLGKEMLYHWATSAEEGETQPPVYHAPSTCHESMDCLEQDGGDGQRRGNDEQVK